MKFSFLFLFISICYFMPKAQEKISTNALLGKWKIQSVLNEGGFYHNLETDSVKIYAKGFEKALSEGGEDSLNAINSTKKIFAELKDQVYQFNNDSSFSISNQKKKPKEEQRGFYRIDKNNAVITMKVIDSDPKNSFEISETIVETKSDKLVLRLEQNGTKLTFEFGRIK